MTLLSTKEAAQRLGVSMQRVQALVKSGRLPAQMVGGSYVIKESDLALVKDRKPGRPRKAGKKRRRGALAQVADDTCQQLKEPAILSQV